MSEQRQKTFKVNRHDQLFKHHFGHKEIVADFLKGRLRPDLLDKIDLTTLRKSRLSMEMFCSQGCNVLGSLISF